MTRETRDALTARNVSTSTIWEGAVGENRGTIRPWLYEQPTGAKLGRKLYFCASSQWCSCSTDVREAEKAVETGATQHAETVVVPAPPPGDRYAWDWYRHSDEAAGQLVVKLIDAGTRTAARG